MSAWDNADLGFSGESKRPYTAQEWEALADELRQLNTRLGQLRGLYADMDWRWVPHDDPNVDHQRQRVIRALDLISDNFPI